MTKLQINWCTSVTSLLMGTPNGELTGSGKATYLGAMEGKFDHVLRQDDNQQLSAISLFPRSAKPFLGNKA